MQKNVGKHWFVITVETNSLVSLNDIIADITETLSLKIHLKMHSKIEYSVKGDAGKNSFRTFHVMTKLL
jgi:hypothetical protein